jgi:hypothetical protein
MKSRIVPVTITAITVGWFAGIFLVAQKEPIQADRLVGRPTPSATTPADNVPVVSASPSPSDTPAVEGQHTVRIALYDIRVNAIDPVTDLVYGTVKDGSQMVAGFTTEKLLAKYPGCKAGSLGELVRYLDKDAPSWMKSSLIKSYGGYSYYYKKPAYTCATDRVGQNTVAEAVAAMKNAILPSLH